MLRILIFLFVVLLIYLIFHKYKYDKNLNKEIFAVFVTLVGMIIFYEYTLSVERKKINQLLIDFEEGKSLICQNQEVNSSEFDYESGTMVFISKKIPEIKYSILKCKPKDKK